MSVYKEGNVSVTTGSNVVTGVNTLWLSNVEQGDAFIVSSTATFYDVASVDSDTQITLTAPYQGDSVSNSPYAIARDFTPLNNIPEMSKGDIETAAIFTRAMRRIDQLLYLNQDAGALTSAGVYPNTSAGISGTTNGDYFFVPESNEFVLYLNSSGSAVEQLRFASLASAMQYASDAETAMLAAEQAQEAAETAQSDAETASNSASQNASLAEQYADEAEISANSSASSASSALNSANDSSSHADRAESAADIASSFSNIYDDTATGLANTVNGDYFSTPSGDSEVYLNLYKNNAGTATLIATYPTKVGIESVVGVREYLTASTTYTLPTSPANGTKYVFTKMASVTPVIETTESISYVGQTDTQLEYDTESQLIIIYNNGIWEVSV